MGEQARKSDGSTVRRAVVVTALAKIEREGCDGFFPSDILYLNTYKAASTRSEARAAASAANGRLGGRPSSEERCK